MFPSVPAVADELAEDRVVVHRLLPAHLRRHERERLGHVRVVHLAREPAVPHQHPLRAVLGRRHRHPVALADQAELLDHQPLRGRVPHQMRIHPRPFRHPPAPADLYIGGMVRGRHEPVRQHRVRRRRLEPAFRGVRETRDRKIGFSVHGGSSGVQSGGADRSIGKAPHHPGPLLPSHSQPPGEEGEPGGRQTLAPGVNLVSTRGNRRPQPQQALKGRQKAWRSARSVQEIHVLWRGRFFSGTPSPSAKQGRQPLNRVASAWRGSPAFGEGRQPLSRVFQRKNASPGDKQPSPRLKIFSSPW